MKEKEVIDEIEQTTQEILEEVLMINEYKKNQKFKYPFDEFWFSEGYRRGQKEILDKI